MTFIKGLHRSMSESVKMTSALPLHIFNCRSTLEECSFYNQIPPPPPPLYINSLGFVKKPPPQVAVHKVTITVINPSHLHTYPGFKQLDSTTEC